MRWMYLIMLLFVLTGCGGQAATSTAAPGMLPPVGELLASAPSGQIATIGYLFINDTGAALVDGLSLSGQPTPLDATGLWLGPPPDLPADTLITVAGAARYLIVEAHGRLEGPGRFGPEGRYRYRLAEAELLPQTVRKLSLALLLANSERYEGEPVQIAGQLLSTADSALLVERLGEGGVPDNAALQIKLEAPPRDETLATHLRRSADGRVTFGPVEIVGLWRTGRLYPLAVVAR